MKWCKRKCHCKRNSLAMSLAELKPGIEAKVSELCHDRRYRSIIVSLGIQLGVTVEVIRNAYSDQGCMIIKVSGNRLIINRKLASKIKIAI